MVFAFDLARYMVCRTRVILVFLDPILYLFRMDTRGSNSK